MPIGLIPKMGEVGKRIGHFADRVLARLAKKNYQLAKAYFHYGLRSHDRQFQKLPILVYQMGKVGSSTVVRSLKEAGIDRSIYHVHFLTWDLINHYENKRRNFLATRYEPYLKHIWEYEYLRNWIDRKKSGESWKILTLVRDPVVRNLSAFFENIEMLPQEREGEIRLKSVEYGFEATVKNGNLDEIIELFFEKCRHDTPLIYFDREFKSIFNLDVYSEKFDKTKGYSIYRKNDAEIGVIRLENLNQCLNEFLRVFLDVPEAKLINSNLGSEKKSAGIYELFKKSICLPESYLDKMYQSRFARHFYTEQEIEKFRAKWSPKVLLS